ncbi:hypothetical protein HanXRQr2_Chr13g0572241 [Helianthus annuus]|uniref:Uncharacterized protein n=1 Tax=Helianthus annuus TaxID=4232 RepID=A0A9K3EF31_HELAN|nr:hypothetical protein HanXRQr2_Chr13g0572241 [Helianthus annuus]
MAFKRFNFSLCPKIACNSLYPFKQTKLVKSVIFKLTESKLVYSHVIDLKHPYNPI